MKSQAKRFGWLLLFVIVSALLAFFLPRSSALKTPDDASPISVPLSTAPMNYSSSTGAQKDEKIIHEIPPYDAIRAVYLASGYVQSDKKANELLRIIETTSANGIVIDFKDSNTPDLARMSELASLFKSKGAYTIARIVAFQDSSFARKHPEAAIKNSTGGLWYSGKKSWQRYWLDPASPIAQEYTIETAKRAIDAGFSEVQFDYIRFPTDGNMNDISYPVFGTSSTSKKETMHRFFTKMRAEISAYSSTTRLSIDIFGEVMTYGKSATIGQDLVDIAESFDVISPMPYPSHYACGAFGVTDPTAHPYTVYFETEQKGLEFLKGTKAIIRPWLQDFTISSIYKCGLLVPYTQTRIREQIEAGSDLGIHGFMLWNASNRFTTSVFGEKMSTSTKTAP